MSKRVIIRIPLPEPGLDPDLVAWVIVDESGQSGHMFQGGLDEVAEYVSGNKIVVLVPSMFFMFASATLPATNRQRTLKALPYVLEDQLADDVEDLHFAIGPRDAEGQTPCAVVRREFMSNWLVWLKSFGIQPHIMLPDVLGSPLDKNHWTIVRDGPYYYVRTQGNSGFVVEQTNAALILSLALAEAGDNKPEQIYLADVDPQAGPLLDISQLDCPVESRDFASEATAWWRDVADKPELDLLQGDFSRREQIGKYWKPWVPAAAMLAGIILLQLIVSAVDYVRFSGKLETLQEEIITTYKTAFPEAKKIVNPRVQMEQKLKALKGGGGNTEGFLNILSRSGEVLAGTQGLDIRNMRYRDGKLEISMDLGDLQILDKLKQQLTEKAGLKVEILSANAKGNKVESRIQVVER